MKKSGTFPVVYMASLVLFLAACQNEESGSDMPEKPKNLPPEAVYVGGLDGGVWAICRPSGNTTILCEIYHPISGELERKMSLRVCFDTIWPQSAKNKTRATFIDSGRVVLDGVELRIDQPNEYFPTSTSKINDIALDSELAQKNYEEFGVDKNCQRVSSLKAR